MAPVLNVCWSRFMGNLLLFFGLLIALLLGGCSSKPQDPFTLTAKAFGSAKGSADVGYIDDGYAWGFIETGFMLNSHGLPDHWRAMVITRKTADGKVELIWPAFAYGHDQANAEVLDHVLVFTAELPDGSLVLMANRAGESPMVITEAVLRLVARRSGTKVISPQTDYYFTKVRQPPGRIWLQGQPLFAANTFPPASVFSLELSPDDLREVMEDTRQRAKPRQAGLFTYLAEEDPIRLSLRDAAELGKAAPAKTAPAKVSAISQPAGYIPRNEDLVGSILLDSVNQNAFFISHHEPGRILKVALGAGPNTPPKVIGVTTFEAEEDKPFIALADELHGYGYFGTDYPGKLVKLAFGGSNGPARRASSTLIQTNWNVCLRLLDTNGGYGYLQVGDQLVKVRLGQGDAPPTVVARLDLPTDAGRPTLGPGLLDVANHCAYFGTDWHKIYKVSLGVGDAPPRILETLTIDGEVHPGSGALIDITHRYAWFISSFGYLYKVALGGPDGPMRYLGNLHLGNRYQYLNCTFGQDDAGYAYLGTGGGGRTGDPECCTCGIMKVDLGKGDALPRMVSFLPLSDDPQLHDGVVDARQRMLYVSVTVGGAGSRILKLKLGDGEAPPELTAQTDLFLK